MLRALELAKLRPGKLILEGLIQAVGPKIGQPQEHALKRVVHILAVEFWPTPTWLLVQA